MLLLNLIKTTLRPFIAQHPVEPCGWAGCFFVKPPSKLPLKFFQKICTLHLVI